MNDAIHEKPSVLRRLWFVILLTALLLTFPIAMIILLTGDVYRKTNGSWRPIGSGPRYVYGGLLAVWLLAVVGRAFLSPQSVKEEWAKSADPAQTRSAQTATAQPSGTTQAAPDQQAVTTADSAEEALPRCDNPEVIQTAREAIDESPAGVTQGLRVRDVGRGQETFYQPERKVRRCVAEVMLNSGGSLMTYQVLYGPSGNLMVQAQVGDAAVMQHEVDKARKEGAEAANRPRDCTPHRDNLSGEMVLPHGCRE